MAEARLTFTVDTAPGIETGQRVKDAIADTLKAARATGQPIDDEALTGLMASAVVAELMRVVPSPLPACGCGEREMTGTVHRADGPCYQEQQRERREAICAWLTANNINIKDVPLDSNIETVQTTKGTVIRYEAYLRDENGRLLANGNSAHRVPCETPLIVDKPEAWPA